MQRYKKGAPYCGTPCKYIIIISFSCFRHWDIQIRKFSEACLLISKQLTFCPKKVTKTGRSLLCTDKNNRFFILLV